MDKPVTTPKSICATCGEVHTGEEGHHCPDWDFMFVRPTDPEMECCTCLNQ